MDPLDFLENDELLRFFHRNKTEMSCFANPHTFLTQMRDHNLVPEDAFTKVSRMKSKDNIQKALYGVLDRLERTRPQQIKVFWRCVFKETIMNHYPALRLLRNSLMDGSFHFEQLPETVEKEETSGRKRTQPPGGEEEEEEEEEEQWATPAKKKRKLRSKSVCGSGEEERPGPSSQLTPTKNKKSKKICFSSPLKKGEKGEIWTWDIFKSQLPVTCGDLEGLLNRARLAEAKKCIWYNKKWFHPSEFESLSDKKKWKNWKLSIRCQDTPLKDLIEDGYLKPGRCKGKSTNAKKSPSPSDTLAVSNEGSDEDEEGRRPSSESGSSTEEEDETDEQPGTSRDGGMTVFNVACGNVAGTFYKKRFASGTCGKCIRTETSWWSPVDFVREASTEAGAMWKKDILWEGKPLGELIEAGILTLHTLLCSCRLCSKDPTDLVNQENDDECYICKSAEEKVLVVCDECPRSFHQDCHLPRVNDAMLRDGEQWLCTFCVFRKNQEWRYSDELERAAVMSQPISQHRLECEYLVLLLYSVDESQTFATDPSLYLSDYKTVVKTPMWLGRVAENLQVSHYQTVGEFVSDIQLIFTNCAAYNKNNSEYRAMGVKLKELFDSEVTNVFKITEDVDC